MGFFIFSLSTELEINYYGCLCIGCTIFQFTQLSGIIVIIIFFGSCLQIYIYFMNILIKVPSQEYLLISQFMQNQKGVDAAKLLPIHAGEVHYQRIPVQYWEHRIRMIKALGLNALSVYIIWNHHEVSRGQFDFSTGNKNLPLFLELAEKYNMLVLFRPGPYVCAQWDFGGMPARLLNIPNLEIRANNKQFLAQTKIYFEALVPIIRKHMRTETQKDRSIVMLQIQNQYGFYGTDKSYMQQIRKMWSQLDIQLTEYYVDWLQNIHKCHWKGANVGINNFSSQQQQNVVRAFEKQGFLIGGQIYSGWMTHWTQKWGGKKTKKVLKDYEYLLNKQHSFAMYMVHGGTNFGLTAGANGLKDKPSDYWGAITSYDYDAPINEQGSATPKYHAIRQLFKKHIKYEFPQIPEPIPMIQIPEITVSPKGSLLNNLPAEQFTNSTPSLFESDQLEMYNQGIVVYETQLENDKDYNLKVFVHDYAVVYLGNKVIQTLDRTKLKQDFVNISKEQTKQHGVRLIFVVQASGHINFDKNMLTDKKGLYSIEGLTQQNHWTMWRFPINYESIKSWKQTTQQNDRKWGQTYPRLFEGEFNLESVGDTYLDVQAYGKGYIWVNGHNLGRYWQAGPQKRLFCPGVWFKKGVNQITILNVYGKAGSSIKGVKQLYDTPVVYSDEE